MGEVSLADCECTCTCMIHLHSCTDLLRIKASKTHLGKLIFPLAFNLSGINATVNVTIKAA